MKQDSTETPPSNPRAAAPTAPARTVRMAPLAFRIAGDHRHEAVAGGHTFSCTREWTTSDAGVSIRWSACDDRVPLKADCRTLNEAKNVCRAAAQRCGLAP